MAGDNHRLLRGMRTATLESRVRTDSSSCGYAQVSARQDSPRQWSISRTGASPRRHEIGLQTAAPVNKRSARENESPRINLVDLDIALDGGRGRTAPGRDREQRTATGIRHERKHSGGKGDRSPATPLRALSRLSIKPSIRS